MAEAASAKPSLSDDELLQRMGLSDADLRDVQEKFSKFVASLNQDQKKVLAATLPTAEQAAATFGPDVTPSQIERFIRSRSGANDAPVVVLNQGNGPIK